MAEPSMDRGNAHWGNIRKSAQEILNVRHEVRRRESPGAVLVDRIGRGLGRPGFFFTMLVTHVGWVVLNLPVFPWQPWDPYPFVLLATITSAEAPLLALVVLMHQQREHRIGELREETSLQVALHVEREATMILRLLRELQEHAGAQSAQDPALLDRMKEFMDPRVLMGALEQGLDRDEGGTTTSFP